MAAAAALAAAQQRDRRRRRKPPPRRVLFAHVRFNRLLVAITYRGRLLSVTDAKACSALVMLAPVCECVYCQAQLLPESRHKCSPFHMTVLLLLPAL